MNERDQIERDDESTSAAESCPKPGIDQLAEPPGSLLKVDGTELSSDASTEPSNNAPEPAILSASHSADDPAPRRRITFVVNLVRKQPWEWQSPSSISIRSPSAGCTG